jgi:hypothetical protein
VILKLIWVYILFINILFFCDKDKSSGDVPTSNQMFDSVSALELADYIREVTEKTLKEDEKFIKYLKYIKKNRERIGSLKKSLKNHIQIDFGKLH